MAPCTTRYAPLSRANNFSNREQLIMGCRHQEGGPRVLFSNANEHFLSISR